MNDSIKRDIETARHSRPGFLYSDEYGCEFLNAIDRIIARLEEKEKTVCEWTKLEPTIYAMCKGYEWHGAVSLPFYCSKCGRRIVVKEEQ